MGRIGEREPAGKDAPVSPEPGGYLLDAGRVIIDRATDEVLFEAGQHQFLNSDGDAFCDYFAAP